LIKTFQPTYHIHGHIHVYSPFTKTETKVGKTLVMNTYGYRKLTFPDNSQFQTTDS
jgi:Icc-related predicted phosphoesterase